MDDIARFMVSLWVLHKLSSDMTVSNGCMSVKSDSHFSKSLKNIIKKTKWIFIIKNLPRGPLSL